MILIGVRGPVGLTGIEYELIDRVVNVIEGRIVVSAVERPTSRERHARNGAPSVGRVLTSATRLITDVAARWIV